jgi:hypothetical protein
MRIGLNWSDCREGERAGMLPFAGHLRRWPAKGRRDFLADTQGGARRLALPWAIIFRPDGAGRGEAVNLTIIGRRISGCGKSIGRKSEKRARPH